MTQALNLFAEFATDETREKDGVWREYGGTEFLVARQGNRKYRERFLKLYKPHERLLKGNTEAAEAKSTEIMVDVMAHTILLDWKGKIVVEKGGSPVEYSVENAKKALSLAGFREVISEFSEDVNAYKIVQEAEDEKNSQSTSSGS